MPKPTKKQLAMVYKVDLKTFHAIRRAQKSIARIERRLQMYRQRLRDIYKDLIEKGSGKVEVVR